MRLLEAIRRLRGSSPLEIVPTLLAAHALPAAYAGRPAAYLETVVRELIPEAARGSWRNSSIASATAAPSAVEMPAVLAAGREHGLVPRLHAEQLADTGASRLAVEWGATSADHFDRLSSDDIARLAHSDVVATLLPGANFHLGLKEYPPARELIEAGAIVALATDFNPGTSPTWNMQFILSLACAALRMTPAEAVTAATINAAWALRRGDRLRVTRAEQAGRPDGDGCGETTARFPTTSRSIIAG